LQTCVLFSLSRSNPIGHSFFIFSFLHFQGERFSFSHSSCRLFFLSLLSSSSQSKKKEKHKNKNKNRTKKYKKDKQCFFLCVCSVCHTCLNKDCVSWQPSSSGERFFRIQGGSSHQCQGRECRSSPRAGSHRTCPSCILVHSARTHRVSVAGG